MKQVRTSNIFYGHMIVGLVFSLAGIWVTTQYVAWALGYQPQLGRPLFIFHGYPVYEPWAWMLWAYHFEPYAPWVFSIASTITYTSFFVMFAIMVVLAVLRSKRQAETGSYGTARWAQRKELEGVGLLGDRGVILAQTNDAAFRSVVKNDPNGDITVQWTMRRHGRNLLRHHGPEHVFCFAPTRSGKGVGLVIPTLLSWTGSCVVYDIKKENWAATAGWRRSFSHCLRFEPTSPGSVRFNPLLEIRRGLFEVRDAQNIADILVDPEGSLERRDHWDKTAHTIFVGAILHILYVEKDKSIAGLVRFLSDPERSIEDTLHYMLNTRHLDGAPHPVVASCAREALNKSPNELSGVISTAMTFLGLFRDPIIAENTAVSDFHVEDLMNSERPVSLYIVVPPSDIDRTKPLIRLILNQMGRRLTEKMTFSHNASSDSASENTRRQSVSRHRMLLMLDEFPSLGRLSFFETELAYLAGYGIKCFMIAQSLNQIEKAYGQNNSILDNSHVRVTYGALDERTAKRISDLLGQATEKRRQLNFAGSRLAPWLGHVMESEQESPRPLLTPGEILQLPGDDALLIVGGIPPYRAKKVMYYQDDRFRDRAWLPAPDSVEEQTAELFRSRVWINAWELPYAEAGVESGDRHPDSQQALKDRPTGIVPAPSLESGLEKRSLSPDLSDDERNIDDDEMLPDPDDTVRFPEEIIEPEEHEPGEDDRLDSDEEQGRNRRIELTRTPEGGGLPL